MNIYDTIQHRNILNQHKRRLLAINYKKSPFQKQLENRNKVMDVVKNLRQGSYASKVNERAREISEENNKHLNKLLTVLDKDNNNEASTRYRPNNYDKYSAMLSLEKETKKQAAIDEIINENYNLTHRIEKAKCISVDKKEFEKGYKIKENYLAHISKYKEGKNRASENANIYLDKMLKDRLETSVKNSCNKNSYENIEIGFQETPLVINRRGLQPLRKSNGEYIDAAMGNQFNNTADQKSYTSNSYKINARGNITNSANVNNNNVRISRDHKKRSRNRSPKSANYDKSIKKILKDDMKKLKQEYESDQEIDEKNDIMMDRSNGTSNADTARSMNEPVKEKVSEVGPIKKTTNKVMGIIRRDIIKKKVGAVNAFSKTGKDYKQKTEPTKLKTEQSEPNIRKTDSAKVYEKEINEGEDKAIKFKEDKKKGTGLEKNSPIREMDDEKLSENKEVTEKSQDNIKNEDEKPPEIKEQYKPEKQDNAKENIKEPKQDKNEELEIPESEDEEEEVDEFGLPIEKENAPKKPKQQRDEDPFAESDPFADDRNGATCAPPYLIQTPKTPSITHKTEKSTTSYSNTPFGQRSFNIFRKSNGSGNSRFEKSNNNKNNKSHLSIQISENSVDVLDI